MTKAKDAFAGIPELPPEEGHEQFDAFANRDADDEMQSKGGGAPRNLLKNLSKVLVPVMALGVVIWLFMPDTGRPRRPIEARAVEIDDKVQRNDSNALIERMRQDASKVKPVLQTAAPTTAQQSPSTAATVTGNTPIPTPLGLPTVAMPRGTPEEFEARQKAAMEAGKRIEEIRASPMEAGNIKLLGDDSGAHGKPSASDLEMEMARVASSQEEAISQQKLAQSAALAALAGSNQAPPKSKNVNQQFLLDASSSSSSAVLRQDAPGGDHIITEGSSVRTVLMTSVVSDLPGKIIARVTSDVYDSNQSCVLIPKGSEIIGVYNSEVAIGQERVLMAMNRLILPNGTWISLAGASATDMIGRSGMQAKVNNHFFKIFSTSLILGGASLMLPKADSTLTTSAGPGGNLTTGGVFATALSDVLKTVLDRNRNIAPTLNLQAGQEFIFIVSQDMALMPYRSC